MAHDDDNLPQSVTDALEAADRPVPLITARVDREIAAMARTHFAARRPRSRTSRPTWAVAAAAAVLLAVLVIPRQQPDVAEPGGVYADVDDSGRIDIADVLALARSREAGTRSQAELDAFAMRIVALDGDTS